MTHRLMNRCSVSLIIRTVKIKTTVRYHLTPVRMTVVKETTNNSVAEMYSKGKTAGGDVN